MLKLKKKETNIVDKEQLVDETVRFQEWQNRVSPSTIEFKKDSFDLEQAHCAVYTVFNYPREVNLGWLRPVSFMSNTLVSIILEEGDKSELMKAIDFTIKEYQSQTSEKLTDLQNVDIKINQALALSEKVAADNVNIGKLTIYISIYAESQEELQKRCKEAEGVLSAYGIIIRKYPYMQEDGFDSINPTITNKYADMVSLTLPLNAFYAGMGIVTSEGINDSANNGFYLGFDNVGNPIFFNPFSKANKRTNANICIMGVPGSGKSALAKTIIINSLLAQTKQFVLDPESEYLSISDELNGNVVDGAGELNKEMNTTRINPLQLNAFPEALDDCTDEQIAELAKRHDFKGSISEKISQLKGWFKVYQPDLNMSHISLIESALYETYKRAGLTEGSNPKDLKNTDNPTMSDLYKIIKERFETATDSADKKLYNEILRYLYSAVEGADRFLFNGHTNINLNNPLNVFDVRKLLDAPENVKNAQFSNIISYLWLALTRDRKEKTVLVVDEAHLFINKGSTTTFEFLGQLCKRARKYSSALWVLTQNVGDFLHDDVSRFGEGILNNSSTKILMKSEATDLQKLSGLFNLNQGEQELIRSASVGHGLIIAGDTRVFAEIDIEPGVLRLCQMGGGV